MFLTHGEVGEVGGLTGPGLAGWPLGPPVQTSGGMGALQGLAPSCPHVEGAAEPMGEASRPGPKGSICMSLACQAGHGPLMVGAGQGPGGGLLCEVAREGLLRSAEVCPGPGWDSVTALLKRTQWWDTA